MKNVRPTGYGFQLYTRVQGRFISEHVPRQPTAMAVREWVRLKHAEIKHGLDVPTPRDGPAFEDDVDDYLASVAAMPSIGDRRLHMAEWARAFAGRDRNTITPLEIRTHLERLRQTLSPGSCNRRRTALMSFYTALNGKSGYNPVRDVPKYTEDAEPRAQPLWTLYRILALMKPSKTRARLRVMLWTGWPQAQLKRLKPAHVDLKRGRAYVTPRRKGKGRAGTWLPLLPGAIIALKDFDRWDCWTPTDKEGKALPFSHSAMHSSFERAVEKFNRHRARLKLPPVHVRPYDLRHSFGTWVAERITDERALQELLMHSRAEQTRRYTEAATMQRVAAAVKLAGRLQERL